MPAHFKYKMKVRHGNLFLRNLKKDGSSSDCCRKFALLTCWTLEYPFGQSGDISDGRMQRLLGFSRIRELMELCLSLEAITQLDFIGGAFFIELSVVYLESFLL